jgi:hypothetical protein
MLLPTAYLPSIDWCAALWSAPEIVLEACEHYQKGSTRNRALIAGPNGVQMLSIPLVKGKHQQTPIREVRISYTEPWQRNHWRSIQTAYGNAPFFEHYEAELRWFYEQECEYLFDFNLGLIEFILIKKMGWKGSIKLSSKYQPTQKQETPVAKPYPQVFLEKQGFIPNLSVLDLFLCCGKQGPEYL